MTSEGEEDDVKDLEILSIIGYDGKTLNALHIHPDGKHIVYPFGNSVTIQNQKTKQQDFLRGHTNLISAVALSPSGAYIASGQINYMGFKALVFIWDFTTRTKMASYEIHKVRVEWLAFSCDDSYLISLGGRDDTNVIVFDMATKQSLCGASANGANTGIAMTVATTNKRRACFLTGGDRTLRSWKIDSVRRKVAFNEVNFNKIKRYINCVTMSDDDSFAYCGTTSGDIVKVALYFSEEISDSEPKRTPSVVGVLGKHIPLKKKNTVQQAECYSRGIRVIISLGKGHLLIGAGDGTVEEVVETSPTTIPAISKRLKDPVTPGLKKIRSHFVDSEVTSMKVHGDDLLVGTVDCEMFSINLKTWSLKLLTTSHTSTVYDVCFPSDMSGVVATSSKEGVRLWNTETSQELLRITVANMTCSGVAFQQDGRGILTSWNDGKIRAFTPQTGQLMYIIHNAHNKGVSALAMTKNGRVIVSGGGEGQVRVWDIGPTAQTLRAVLQEHKGPVSAININNADDEAASASTDGSCIIWDISRCVRKNIIFANTLFMAVRFHTTDSQILTTGTNRKIAYWETFDGSLIRDIEGSADAALNTIDISPCGGYFVTGGNDQMLKIWDYQEGTVTHVGIGHCGIITRARFSPDGHFIISVSSDGAVFRWRNPHHK